MRISDWSSDGCSSDLTIYLKRTSPLMAQLGANIARELKKLGITQGELSERSGVAASNISYMVRGHGNPTLATLESLADVFGLSEIGRASCRECVGQYV